MGISIQTRCFSFDRAGMTHATVMLSLLTLFSHVSLAKQNRDQDGAHEACDRRDLWSNYTVLYSMYSEYITKYVFFQSSVAQLIEQRQDSGFDSRHYP
jgi:hypothetical protein